MSDHDGDDDDFDDDFDDDLDIVYGYPSPGKAADGLDGERKGKGKEKESPEVNEKELAVLSGSETCDGSGPGEGHDEVTDDDDDDGDLDAPVVREKNKRGRYLLQSHIGAGSESGSQKPREVPRAGMRSEEGMRVKKGEQRVEEEEEKAKEVNPVRTKPRKDGRGEKIVMTDDEEEEGDVYANWKRGRMAEKRKRAGVGSKEAGGAGTGAKRQKVGIGVDGGGGGKNRPFVGRRPGKTKHNAMVGIRPASTARRQRNYRDIEDDLEDSLSQLPAHLQKRKEVIDIANKTLDERAALKLAPDYDEVEFSDEERLEELAERPAFSDIKPPSKYEDIHMNTTLGVIPAPIAQWLRDYQVKGTQFLHEKFVYQRGGILGDDMGLGKTVQVIAFLTAAFGKTGDERDKKRMRKKRRLGDPDEVWYPRVLIVCPGTLMENWKSELDTWGWWIYDVYHGIKDDKESALRAAQNGLTEIMITTYTTYKNSRDAINMIPWDCVIADECHIIKERTSDITKAMNEVNSLCRIGLTGTALQNRYEELWTLLNWCNPGSVGPPHVWNKTISKPLKLGQAHDATNRQLGNARRIADQLVTNLLPRMFLRRMKSLIAEQLPKKSDRVVFCPLTETQTEAYERFCESEAVTLVKYSTAICDCGSRKKRGYCCYQETESGKSWRELVFPCIQNVLKLCNHIANWIPLNEEPPDKRAEKLDWLQACLPDDWERLMGRPPLENYMDLELCGKWIILQKLLSFWHSNGDKVLIFSYSIRLLDILRCLFANTSYNVDYLDGKMPLEDRARAVSNFNHSPMSFIFLISTRAGGVGLNITSANKVVIFDPSWNPSHDLQAQDRAYRIGQRRDVEVFRLVCAGTIEEIVYARQIYKQQQANIGYGASTERRYFTGVMGEEGRKGELFGLVNMFTFHGESGGGVGGLLVKEVVNKTNVAEGRAGVAVIGYDAEAAVDDDGDDDSLLGDIHGDSDDDDKGDPVSQLEALVTGKSKLKRARKRASGSDKKMNPVQAILSAAGVQYTHENSEVIGSSAIEAQISRRAIETTNDPSSIGDVSAFGAAPAGATSFTANNPTGGGKDRETPVPVDEDTVLLNGVTYRFHPPEDVQKRQFCSMAKMFGFGSVQEFALVVEGWTPVQRRKALERFYRLIRGGEGGAPEGIKDAGGEEKEEQQLLPQDQDAVRTTKSGITNGNAREETAGQGDSIDKPGQKINLAQQEDQHTPPLTPTTTLNDNDNTRCNDDDNDDHESDDQEL